MTSRTGFVTGSTGFLGLNLIEQLSAKGWSIHAMHRSTSDVAQLRRYPRLKLVNADLEDADAVMRTMPDDLDAIFHVAADVSFWSRNDARQNRCNVDGTRNVVVAALRHRARKFVHTSTFSVYGFQPAPFDETAPHLGRDSWINYLRTKTLAEDEVHRGIARGLDAVILNPSNIIGAYDRGNWSRLFMLARSNQLSFLPPGRGSFCHAEAVAAAHISAVDHGRTGANYLLGGADASYVEVGRMIGKLMGKSRAVRPLPKAVVKLAAGALELLTSWGVREPPLTRQIAAFMCSDFICRSDLAIRDLHYRPADLTLMLEDCHRWMTAEGLI